MALQYEQALQVWASKRLQNLYQINGLMIDKKTVTVEMEFDEGTYCCDGDNGCYCSLAESPSANVRIKALGSVYNDDKILYLSMAINHDDFDFVTILKEIVEAGDGEISLEEPKKKGVRTRPNAV